MKLWEKSYSEHDFFPPLLFRYTQKALAIRNFDDQAVSWGKWSCTSIGWWEYLATTLPETNSHFASENRLFLLQKKWKWIIILQLVWFSGVNLLWWVHISTKRKIGVCILAHKRNLRGVVKYFLFSSRKLGKCSNLTSIFFRWVGRKPPTRNHDIFGTSKTCGSSHLFLDPQFPCYNNLQLSTFSLWWSQRAESSLHGSRGFNGGYSQVGKKNIFLLISPIKTDERKVYPPED